MVVPDSCLADLRQQQRYLAFEGSRRAAIGHSARWDRLPMLLGSQLAAWS
jgi:hypothetical protein